MQACAIMFGVKVLLIWLSAAEELDMENEFLLPPVFGEEYEEQPRPRSKKKVWIVMVFLYSYHICASSELQLYTRIWEDTSFSRIKMA